MSLLRRLVALFDDEDPVIGLLLAFIGVAAAAVLVFILVPLPVSP